MKYQYYTNCVNFPENKVDELSEMIDNALMITYETFIKHVSYKSLLDLFPFYIGSGLHIKNDFAVGFHRSKLFGKRVYYVRHSAIEYIFIK